MLTELVVNPFAIVGLLNWVTTTSLISSMDGLDDTYSSNGGRYCFMGPVNEGREGGSEGGREGVREGGGRGREGRGEWKGGREREGKRVK